MDVDLETMTAEHAPFLRRLAHALVGDHDGAEDLVQETWLAAAEQPRGRVRSPRAWLAGTARRLAASGRRRGARERLTHLASEPAGEASEPTEIISALEAERALIAALESLPGPQRTAVWLRYREGMGVTEIAERVGAPSNTVRGRLRRGLAALRERLEESHGSAVSALGALLPRSPGARGDRPWSGAESSTVSRAWIPALAAPAALAVLVAMLVVPNEEDRSDLSWLARDVDEGAQEVGPRPGASERVARAESERHRPSAASGSEDAVQELAVDGDAVPPVTVRVIDEDGSPAAGARVWSVEGASKRSRDVPQHASIATGEGVASVPDHGGAMFTIFAASPVLAAPVRFGHALVADAELASRWSVEVVEGGRDRAGPIEVVLRRAPFLAGRVTDPEGEGVAGVVVVCTMMRGGVVLDSPATKTDGDGRFEWASIPIDPRQAADELLCDLTVFRRHLRRARLGGETDVPLNREGIVIVAETSRAEPGSVIGELRTYDGRNAPADVQLYVTRRGPQSVSPIWVHPPRLDDGSVVPGYFQVHDVPSGAFDLDVRSQDSGYVGGLGDLRVVAGEVTDVGVIEVGPGGQVELIPELTRSAMDLPKDEVMRSLRRNLSIRSSFDSSVSLESTEDGWRTAHGVAPGTWRLEQRESHPLYLDMEPVVIRHGESVQRRVRVRAARRLALELHASRDTAWSSVRITLREMGSSAQPPVELAPRARASVIRRPVSLSLPCLTRVEIRATTDTGLEATAEITVGGPDGPTEPIQMQLDRPGGD